FDYGGTLVEELRADLRAGTEAVLQYARQPVRSLDEVMARADRVTRELADRRDEFHIETPWISLTRLIHDAFGTVFSVPLDRLELVFWDACVTTAPMPGVVEALDTLRHAGIPMGVVSNSSFGGHVIRHELAKHGIADFM